MPNNKQAKKRARQDEERRGRNKSVKTAMRTSMKRVLQAGTAEDAQAALPMAFKRIDKAAKTNIIHANAAGRYKSRLTQRVAAK